MTILTPKGYTPARQPSDERPTASPAQAPQGGQPTSGEAQIELHFRPQVVGVNCPNCGTPYPVQVFSIVDVGQDPILKSVVLSGQLNVASCPKCQTTGAISAPLLYHDPAHQFLGVYVPEQMPINQQQQMIGELSKRLMDGLPQEARRGYMLTPKQFLGYQGLLDAILENEGITREMREGQRRRMHLIEQALIALQDPQGLKLLVSEHDAEMDDQFFGLLQFVSQTSAAAGDERSLNSLLDLQERLIELSTWGKSVQRQRSAVAQLKPETTPAELLDLIVKAEDSRVVDALVATARPLVDYGFYQALTQRIEQAEQRGQRDEAKRLSDLRDHILELTERLDEMQRAAVEEASRTLAQILAAPDIPAAVEEHADMIDQVFLSVVAANLQQAERQRATAAVKRLAEVWEAVMSLVQGSAPPEAQLINRLLEAEYPAQTRKILSENQDLVTAELVEIMTGLVEQLDEEGDSTLATRVRQLRSQAQLML